MEKQLPKFNPETELRSDLWTSMSIDNLWLQRSLLMNRMMYCQQHGKPSMLQQMERGLKFLDAIIEEKSNKEKNVADSVVIRY